MVPWLFFVTFTTYAVVAGLTARTVFGRLRAGFVTGGRGAGTEWLEERFEEQERAQAEAMALVSGLCWVVAVPALVLRRVVTGLVLDRPAPRSTAAPSHAVAARIEELERELALGPCTPTALPGGPPQPHGAKAEGTNAD